MRRSASSRLSRPAQHGRELPVADPAHGGQRLVIARRQEPLTSSIIPRASMPRARSASRRTERLARWREPDHQQAPRAASRRQSPAASRPRPGRRAHAHLDGPDDAHAIVRVERAAAASGSSAASRRAARGRPCAPRTSSSSSAQGEIGGRRAAGGLQQRAHVEAGAADHHGKAPAPPDPLDGGEGLGPEARDVVALVGIRRRRSGDGAARPARRRSACPCRCPCRDRPGASRRSRPRSAAAPASRTATAVFPTPVGPTMTSSGGGLTTSAPAPA